MVPTQSGKSGNLRRQSRETSKTAPALTSSEDAEAARKRRSLGLMNRSGVHPASALCRPNVPRHLVFEHEVNHAVIVCQHKHKFKSALGAEVVYDLALLGRAVKMEADTLTHQPSIASEKTTPTREARSAPSPPSAHILACVRR
jgi:hypothetical protein